MMMAVSWNGSKKQHLRNAAQSSQQSKAGHMHSRIELLQLATPKLTLKAEDVAEEFRIE